MRRPRCDGRGFWCGCGGLLELAEGFLKGDLACLALACQREEAEGFRREAGHGCQAFDALKKWIWRCHG